MVWASPQTKPAVFYPKIPSKPKEKLVRKHKRTEQREMAFERGGGKKRFPGLLPPIFSSARAKGISFCGFCYYDLVYFHNWTMASEKRNGEDSLPPFLIPLPEVAPSSIRGHRPNYSLGVKFLANREGDYESCFREGEENYKAGYGKGMGKKFRSPIFCAKLGGEEKILKILLY